VLEPPQPVYPVPPRRRPVLPVVALVILAVLVALLGGFLVARQLQAPTEVALEPVATTGADPFMPSVGTDSPAVRPVANAGGRYSGGTPGLYGGTGDNAVCDRTQLSRYLGQHPDKAAGWAAVLGLRGSSSADVASYVAGLTPVLLRTDTFVTNHGWSGGAVTSFPAVLQAGSAVLVDGRGVAVTRCFCGNPLSAPMSFGAVSYVGPRWVSFSATSVTVIVRNVTVENHYTLVDVHTGRGRERPAGTAGDHDTVTVAPEDPLTRPGTEPDPSEGDGNGAEAAGAETTTTDPSATSVPSADTDPASADTASATSDPSTSPTDPSSSSSPSASGGAAPSELAGTWTPGAECRTVTGPVTFSGTGSYEQSGEAAGSYTWSGTQLTLTPSGGSSVGFRADGTPPSTFTSTATGACVLSHSS
jgi:hypothetical protein